MRGWFDLDWEYVPVARGATVHPGKPKVPDINRWEEYVSIPDLDALDWDGCRKNNIEYLKNDKLNELGLLSSLWERLMALMDVDKAAMALIDEDQKEGVHRLFGKLADFYDDYIGRMKEICDIDCLEMHDDWGHQTGPFFSLETAREMIVPYIKRVSESCHKRGMYLELHSCGRNELLIPGFIESGVDIWCGQAQINDLNMLAHKYAGSSLVFGVAAPDVPENASAEEVRSCAKRWVNDYKDCRVAISSFFQLIPRTFGTLYMNTAVLHIRMRNHCNWAQNRSGFYPAPCLYELNYRQSSSAFCAASIKAKTILLEGDNNERNKIMDEGIHN